MKPTPYYQNPLLDFDFAVSCRRFVARSLVLYAIYEVGYKHASHSPKAGPPLFFARAASCWMPRVLPSPPLDVPTPIYVPG